MCTKFYSQVPPSSCSVTKEITLMVKLSFGDDLLTQRDLVQENNVQKIKYRCDKGKLYVWKCGANVPRLT